jgi:hypothetical protein
MAAASGRLGAFQAAVEELGEPGAEDARVDLGEEQGHALTQRRDLIAVGMRKAR